MKEADRKRKEIGRRLERRRLELGLSVVSAARASGVSRWTWMRWGDGDSSVPAELVPGVAKALTCDVVWLLTGREPAAAAKPAAEPAVPVKNAA